MSELKPRILVIEDEAPIRRFLRATLGAHGYEIEEATTARDGLLQAAQHPPDLILLDLTLPDGDGIDVARSIRTWTQLPIVVLSARGQESDKVAALDVGADDYLTKPFGVGELAARIRVALRHAARREPLGSTDAVWEAAEEGRRLRVDLSRRRVTLIENGQETDVRLTPTEFKLLAMLVRHAGKVLTHRQLLVEVWGPPHAGDVQYLRVYAGQLRTKLERDPSQPRFLLTEPGVGYRLVEGT
ncbi:MAG: response regulator [Phycisphaerae bacterium]|jgi:two-component system KDP operon response regulator KdpE|nr:response regulator [Phycisphaerae bacterium]